MVVSHLISSFVIWLILCSYSDVVYWMLCDVLCMSDVRAFMGTFKTFQMAGRREAAPFRRLFAPMPEFNVSSYHIVCVQWCLIVFRGTQWMSLVLWRCPPVGNGAVERTEALKQQCCAFPSFLLHFYFPFFPFLCLTIFLTYLCSAPTSLPPLGPPISGAPDHCYPQPCWWKQGTQRQGCESDALVCCSLPCRVEPQCCCWSWCFLFVCCCCFFFKKKNKEL